MQGLRSVAAVDSVVVLNAPWYFATMRFSFFPRKEFDERSTAGRLVLEIPCDVATQLIL
jgi:hypothetical protein